MSDEDRTRKITIRSTDGGVGGVPGHTIAVLADGVELPVQHLVLTAPLDRSARVICTLMVDGVEVEGTFYGSPAEDLRFRWWERLGWLLAGAAAAFAVVGVLALVAKAAA